MGKQGRNQQRWREDQPWRPGQQHSAAQSWSIWSGAWKSPSAQKDRRHQFPAYDAVPVEDSGMVVVSERRYRQDPDEQHSLVNVVQGAVNQARKFSHKVDRLKKELANKDIQWKAYMTDMKLALQQERKRHNSAVTRLEEDIKETQHQLLQVNDQLQRAAAQGLLRQALPNHERDADWDAMMVDSEEKATAGIARELEAWLQATKTSQQQPTTPPRRAMGAPPMTPPPVPHMNPGPAQGPTQPTFGGHEGPYRASPSHPTDPPMPEQGRGEDAVTETSPKPKRPKDPSPRKPVKKPPTEVHHAPTNAATLADKLGDKRQGLIQERLKQEQAQARASLATSWPATAEAAHPSGAIDLEQSDDDPDFNDISKGME